jgi:alkanesulfonate monooxygenase SsuD/methylene tetrahydromethanopterin reductase-like flavin-dependent oxidoreductase (luciferase family)
MTTGDLGHELRFGVFLAPVATGHHRTVRLARLADEAGLDLLGVQDHPYQASFLDTWTLLATLAPQTERIRLVPDVVNLPLRPPAVLARAAASLDVLSAGRFELGIGAGAFWDGVEAMGGPRRSPREAVEALEEAIAVLRALWAPGPPVEFHGDHYELRGAAPGPLPRHRIGIWIGAYKRRMLELTGRTGDGWLPSEAYAPPAELAEMSRIVDDAAQAAGRSPADVLRIYNVDGGFDDPRGWAERLAHLALTQGISGFVVGPGDDAERDVRTFADEVAPLVRAMVADARGSPEPAAAVAAAPGPTPEPVAGERPRFSEPGAAPLTQEEKAMGEALVLVHGMYREELRKVRDGVDLVASMQTDLDALPLADRMTVRQNHWTLGMMVASYARMVTVHHTIEDVMMFRRLLEAQPRLQPVIHRLEEEHEVIAAHIEALDAALIDAVRDPADSLDVLRERVHDFGDVLLSHLDYEERELVEPLGRYRIEV